MAMLPQWRRLRRGQRCGRSVTLALRKSGRSRTSDMNPATRRLALAGRGARSTNGCFGVVFVASLRFFQITNDVGKFGGQPLEGDDLRAVEGARVITALHALFDQVCGYLSGSLRISDLTSMIVDKQTKDTTKSMHKMTFADVKENVRRMVQDHEDGGVEYHSDIDNLASLESMTLILDQGFAKSFSIRKMCASGTIT